MPSEEDDTEEHHYTTWLMAQQKVLKKLKGRRLAKEEVIRIYLRQKFLALTDRDRLILFTRERKRQRT